MTFYVLVWGNDPDYNDDAQVFTDKKVMEEYLLDQFEQGWWDGDIKPYLFQLHPSQGVTISLVNKLEYSAKGVME